MADFTSVTGMMEDVLHRAGEVPSNASKFYDKTLEYLNRIRLNLIMGISPIDPKTRYDFKWAIEYPPSNFIIQPMIETGTVAMVTDSTTVTFSDAPAVSVEGYRLILDDYDDIYRITAHTAGVATATIDAGFTDVSDATASFKLIKIEYTLGSSDIIRLVSPLKVYRNTYNLTSEYKIYGLEEEIFDNNYPLTSIGSGVPDAFKIVKVDGNSITIILSHYSEDDKMKVEYKHIKKPSLLTTSSTEADIKVPYEFRTVMCDWATGLIQKDKSDNKFQDSINMAQLGFMGMVNDYKLSDTDTSPIYGRVISREDY